MQINTIHNTVHGSINLITQGALILLSLHISASIRDVPFFNKCCSLHSDLTLMYPRVTNFFIYSEM